MNRLINFLVNWKLKRGTVVIGVPYYGVVVHMYEFPEDDGVSVWITKPKGRGYEIR